VLLPSVAARREAFDEYCKDRARELREKAVKEKKDVVNPQEAFERLLKEEVKSTRTSWSDWRRTWKKDRRFYGWGRDDREREKRFREYLKELGESKQVRLHPYASIGDTLFCGRKTRGGPKSRSSLLCAS
jgi:transcription elongation regulator 1